MLPLVLAFRYPIGAPLALYMLLYQHRARLNPPGMEEAEAIEWRNKDEVLAAEPVTQFSITYRPIFWWYEVYNMARRLLLTSVVLAFPTLASTILFMVSVGMVTLLIEQKCKPHGVCVCVRACVCVCVCVRACMYHVEGTI